MNKEKQKRLLQSLNGAPFRWGGFEHDYEKTAGEWKKELGDKHFTNCWCCGNKLAENKPVYVGYFFINESEGQFRIMCRKCAYSFPTGVIESDGKAYRTFKDFKDRKPIVFKGEKE